MVYEQGNTVYIILNNIRVSEAVILSKQGSFYVIRIYGSSGAIRVRESRLYKTKEDAENQIISETPPKRKNQYDYQ